MGSASSHWHNCYVVGCHGGGVHRLPHALWAGRCPALCHDPDRLLHRLQCFASGASTASNRNRSKYEWYVRAYARASDSADNAPASTRITIVRSIWGSLGPTTDTVRTATRSVGQVNSSPGMADGPSPKQNSLLYRFEFPVFGLSDLVDLTGQTLDSAGTHRPSGARGAGKIHDKSKKQGIYRWRPVRSRLRTAPILKITDFRLRAPLSGDRLNSLSIAQKYPRGCAVQRVRVSALRPVPLSRPAPLDRTSSEARRAGSDPASHDIRRVPGD